MLRLWRTCNPWQRLAVVAWGVILLATCARGLLYAWPKHQGIYRVYAEAGRHWAAGENVYLPGFDWVSFPYGPLAAALLAPFGALPDALGSACWRCLNVALFLGALSRWGRAVLPGPLTATQRALLFLLVIPLAAPTMLNAQMGGVIVSLLLLTVAAAAEEHWGWAAVFAGLAALIKVYPLAVGLLLAVAYPRRFAGRLAAALLAGLALPFLLQRPGYVAAQYAGWLTFLHDWVQLLRGDDPESKPLLLCNFNLLLLFRVWLVPLDVKVYQAVQLVAAAACAALVAAGRRAGWPRRRLLDSLLGLAGCWMTLFGTAVESFTYILLAPTLAQMLLEAWQEPCSRWYRGTLLVAWGLFTAATLAVWTPYSGRIHSLGPHAIAALLLLGCLLVRDVPRLRTAATRRQMQALECEMR